MCWNPVYVFLILTSTIITWLCGLGVERVSPDKRKIVLISSIIANLGILIFFKYSNFLVDNVNYVLAGLGIKAVNSIDIILPVGISFYTFQAIGYTVDVYKGETKAEKNFFKYALFVSFFPQLVAGPIERSKNLLTQIREESTRKLWNYERIIQGLITMVWGLFIKIVISDRVAILVNQVFGHYKEYQLFGLLIGALGFALQIYTDFGGYSTIAIGAAKVLGFELMENFNAPYFATSVSDFWHRWHISLSTWFRDYIYIPLGGNRCSKIKKYRNILITFTLSGLWHGSDWTYVIWGMLHGLYQIIGDILKPIKLRIHGFFHTQVTGFGYKFLQGIVTFCMVDFAWIFFRAASIREAFEYIGRMFTFRDWWSFFDDSIFSLGLDSKEIQILVVATIVMAIVDVLKYVKGETFASLLSRQTIIFRWLVLFYLIISIIIYGCYGYDFESSQFIYFQF